ncbi:hypothetical protein [Vibrio gallaecicus]|uniref:hypothetical protein n=1 Tax=Vibrio gallaecicus TaxID=552386 RepID=UPI0025B54DD1|nr:hypothetical protein [Vibrio gallaecicus]MDN3613832.1 hypothetical protein [Vibrio gallaecicus]
MDSIFDNNSHLQTYLTKGCKHILLNLCFSNEQTNWVVGGQYDKELRENFTESNAEEFPTI